MIWQQARNTLKYLLGISAAVLIPITALANTFSCQGPVNYLGLNSGGSVVVDIGNGRWTICVNNTTWGGVTPETCQAYYASLLSLRLSGEDVRLYFDVNNSLNSGLTVGDCSNGNMGSWTNRPIYFFMPKP
ncbi:MAG: hypothetical protein AAGI28_12950 [Pseudomonadota bacterium]